MKASKGNNRISKSRAFHNVGAAYTKDISKNELVHVLPIGGTHNKQGSKDARVRKVVHLTLTLRSPGFSAKIYIKKDLHRQSWFSKHIYDLYCFIISLLKGNHIVLKNNNQYSDKYKKNTDIYSQITLAYKMVIFFSINYTKKDFFYSLIFIQVLFLIWRRPHFHTF